MFSSRFCRRSRQAAIASALFLAFGAAAYAAPGGPHGPGGFGRGAHMEQVIAQLKSQLNLNTSQQLAFDNAVAATKSARATMRTEMDKVRAAMQAELATATPNLRSVATIADQVHAKGAETRRQIRDQWLALYDTFSPEQKTVVRDALAKRAERMEHFRGMMRERFGG